MTRVTGRPRIPDSGGPPRPEPWARDRPSRWTRNPTDIGGRAACVPVVVVVDLWAVVRAVPHGEPGPGGGGRHAGRPGQAGQGQRGQRAPDPGTVRRAGRPDADRPAPGTGRRAPVRRRPRRRVESAIGPDWSARSLISPSPDRPAPGGRQPPVAGPASCPPAARVPVNSVIRDAAAVLYDPPS
jgi:hypothetical protein